MEEKWPFHFTLSPEQLPQFFSQLDEVITLYSPHFWISRIRSYLVSLCLMVMLLCGSAMIFGYQNLSRMIITCMIFLTYLIFIRIMVAFEPHHEKRYRRLEQSHIRYAGDWYARINTDGLVIKHGNYAEKWEKETPTLVVRTEEGYLLFSRDMHESILLIRAMFDSWQQVSDWEALYRSWGWREYRYNHEKRRKFQVIRAVFRGMGAAIVISAFWWM